MKPLYALTEDFSNVWEAILDAADAGDGSIPPDLQCVLDGIEGEFADKVESCVRILKDLEHRAVMNRAAAAELLKSAQAGEKHADWLRGYVIRNLDAVGKTELRAGLFRLAIRDNPEKLNVLDETKIPAEHWRQPQPEIDRPGLKAALQAGVPCEGAELTRGRRLDIK